MWHDLGVCVGFALLRLGVVLGVEVVFGRGVKQLTCGDAQWSRCAVLLAKSSCQVQGPPLIVTLAAAAAAAAADSKH